MNKSLGLYAELIVLSLRDIGYSFLIGGDGRVYVGRGWGIQGAHTYGYNSVALGFSLIGNFMQTAPTQAAISTTQKVLRCGIEKVRISRGYDHRDLWVVRKWEIPSI